jgi:hypothetical protein
MTTDTETPIPDTEEAPVAPETETALAEAPASLLERLESAQDRYRAVVVQASDGDAQAAAEARGLELTIAAIIDEAKRESLAREMRRRQALAEREQQLREQRTRDREEYSSLLAEREEAFASARRALLGFAVATRALFEVEGRAQDLAGRCEERFVSEKHSLSYAVAVVGRDVGLDDDVLGYVMAAQRKALLARFPDLLDHEVEVSEVRTLTGEPETRPESGQLSSATEAAASARCSVCTHEDRDGIEAALADGMPYRDVAATFGVSRSALARHKAHLTKVLT